MTTVVAAPEAWAPRGPARSAACADFSKNFGCGAPVFTPTHSKAATEYGSLFVRSSTLITRGRDAAHHARARYRAWITLFDYPPCLLETRQIFLDDSDAAPTQVGLTASVPARTPASASRHADRRPHSECSPSSAAHHQDC
eukprot:scaffold119165_cov60-Phaeocystis_antarctica.AAC.1